MGIARALGICCSRRCELLLAFAYQREPEQIVNIAHHLANDERSGAIKLAATLAELPTETAQELAVETLRQAGLFQRRRKDD